MNTTAPCVNNWKGGSPPSACPTEQELYGAEGRGKEIIDCWLGMTKQRYQRLTEAKHTALSLRTRHCLCRWKQSHPDGVHVYKFGILA